jgi:hypothetical protein
MMNSYKRARSTDVRISLGSVLLLVVVVVFGARASQSHAQDVPVHFVVNARLYDSIKGVLAPGDALWMSVARGPNPENAEKCEN